MEMDVLPICSISPHQMQPEAYHLINLHPNQRCPYTVIPIINQAILIELIK